MLLASDIGIAGPVRLPVDSQPVTVPFDGTNLPRSLTDAERELLDRMQWTGGPELAPSTPPSGPVRTAAEYDPMEALVLSWTGSTAWLNILGQIARRVTVEANGRVYIGVTGTSPSTQASATTTLNTYGANLANVTFYTVPLNSIWVRDYGPRYAYEGNVRIIADHQYNRPRPLDNNQPVAFGNLKQQQYYEMGINSTTLIHGGGNYHLNALGDAYATQLIANENPTLTTPQIQQVWQTYQNNNTTITSAFPTSVDATQHIDMWMQIYDDNKVFISDWPNNPGSTQDNICDSVAALMQSRGYQVTRLPAYLSGGSHYTFTNMVIFNNVVLLPTYNNGPGATVSNNVAAQVQSAFGAGKTVYQINADQLVTAAGVFHCIVMHVPAHKGLAGVNGGLAPTAYLRGPNNGETLLPGQQYNIQWISDDDAPIAATGGVQGVDIFLSTDGGATFPITIATNRPALGSFLWTVPGGIDTSTARIRVVARDALNNTGFDDSDVNFTIGTPSLIPNQPSLDAAFDTGVSNSDGVTRFNNSSVGTRLQFTVTGTVSGATVSIYADGVLVGSAVASGASTTVLTDGSTTIPDGVRSFTARQTEPSLPQSADSTVRFITIDTIAPTISVPGSFYFDTLPQQVRYSFSENVGPTVLTSSLNVINRLGGPVPTVASVNYNVSNQAAFNFSGVIADSHYRASLSGVTDIAGNALSTNGQFDFLFMLGDANNDGIVNGLDFNALAPNFGQSPRVYSQGDFNYDGTVNGLDFNILAPRFGTFLPPPPPGGGERPGSSLPPGASGGGEDGVPFGGPMTWGAGSGMSGQWGPVNPSGSGSSTPFSSELIGDLLDQLSGTGAADGASATKAPVLPRR